ncbi:MAG: TlpA family protein disulfide reductase [Robiginitomaculum sp.]|nr:TlpA family protein disulfide reductase [Robiginitomaculum sp.]
MHRFAKGGLKKLIVLDDAPSQPTLTFSAHNNQRANLQDFRGRVVILNVWATWCAPCIAEIPSLDQLQREYSAQGLKVVAVSMDRHRVEAESFYKTINVQNLDLYHDSTLSMAADVGVQGLPISIFYDKQGREIARVPGEINWQSEDVKAFLSHILN